MPDEHFIGLMSGTSLDGVDACLMAFPSSGPRMQAGIARAFPRELQHQLRVLAGDSHLSPELLAETEPALSDAYATAVRELIQTADIPLRQITAIGCHGQTIRHLPALGFSWQIGNPARLAVNTGLPVVADFRRGDMARGGQGAPLAPLFHQAFFGDERQRRMVVNIGGIANVSCLVPGEPVRGWDTGPGNTLMDAWYRRHHDHGNWDEGGRWAAEGTVREELLARLLSDPYLEAPAPKSTGPEHFNLDWLARRAGPLLEQHDPADIQASLLELSCRPIAAAARSLEAEQVVVAGGGAFNARLLDRLGGLLGDIPLLTSDSLGIAADQVESAGFAWLARARWYQQPVPLETVTGADGNGPAGAIWHP